jgi:outer membrane lipoprotein SlyB
VKRSIKGQAVVVLLLASLMTACLAPEPILRSNKKLQLYGREAAQEEINTCREKVEQAGLTPGVHQSGNAATGAVLGVTLGGAVGASAGVVGGLTGVAIGAAAGAGLGLVIGLVGGTFKPVVPDPPYADAVAKCLKEKGYEVSSWE